MAVRRRQVAVIGASSCEPDSELARFAATLGRLLAEAGITVICGGLGGVMREAARGAAEIGGTVIGIAPGTSIAAANPYCTHVVATGVGHARNLAVVASGEVAIAVGGGWGTLSEIGHARGIGRTVIALRSWDLIGEGEMASAPGVLTASDPAAAVALALEALGE